MTEELTRTESLRRERAEGIPKRRKRTLRDWLISLGVIFLVFVLPISVFVIIPSSMNVYDRTHHITMECHVKKIYSESTSTRSAKGVGASGRHIVFATGNCRGHLLLEKGVYWDNVDELTKSLKPGRYEITVGQSEWTLAPAYRIFRVSPTIQEYQYLGK